MHPHSTRFVTLLTEDITQFFLNGRSRTWLSSFKIIGNSWSFWVKLLDPYANLSRTRINVIMYHKNIRRHEYHCSVSDYGTLVRSWLLIWWCWSKQPTWVAHNIYRTSSMPLCQYNRYTTPICISRQYYYSNCGIWVLQAFKFRLFATASIEPFSCRWYSILRVSNYFLSIIN